MLRTKIIRNVREAPSRLSPRLALACLTGVLVVCVGVILGVKAGSSRWEALQAYLLLLSFAGVAWTIHYAKRSVELSRETLETGLRPAVIIQLLEHRQYSAPAAAHLSLRNVGVGAALNVVARADDFPKFKVKVDPFPNFSGIPAGEETPSFLMTVGPEFREYYLMVEYRDLVGHRWTSRQRLIRIGDRSWAADTMSISRDCCVGTAPPRGHPTGARLFVSSKNLEQKS